MLSEISASALRFTRVVGWFGCCRSCGNAEVDDLRWRDAASSAPATTTWLKADGPRSLFCRLVSSGVSSNSAGSGNLDLSTAVADVDGADCWGSAKIRETLIRAGDCFEGACHVGIKFLFVAASSSGSKLGSSATSDISTASVADLSFSGIQIIFPCSSPSRMAQRRRSSYSLHPWPHAQVTQSIAGRRSGGEAHVA